MSKPSKLHDQLARLVLDHIASTDMPEGTHLPEPELCDRFLVSRTPIRGALDLLRKQGYLVHQPNRGFFTTEKCAQHEADNVPETEEDRLYLQIAEDRVNQRLPAQNSEADLLRRYRVRKGLLTRVLQRLMREGLAERRPGRGWMFTPVLDSKQMHDESYRFRLAIEPLALLEDTFRLDEEAAARVAARHERVLDGSLKQITSIELFDMNAEFHELLAASSRNRFFLQAIQQQNRLRRFVNYHWTYGADRVLETCREHMSVLRAVRDGDLTWASSLLRKHLEVSASVSPYPELPEGETQEITGEPERVIRLAR